MRNAAIILLLVIVLVLGVASFGGYFSDESTDRNETDQSSDATESPDFTYPEELDTTYIHPVDWPPQLRVEEQSYSCLEAGSETERAGRTEERVLDGSRYCVTTIAEGAAGSVYRQYVYAFAENDRTAYLTFSLRFPQCGNYGEPEKSLCEEEQAAFDPDTLIRR